jgi:hypothetical protein
MERENELIELAIVSVDTKGVSALTSDDEEGGWKPLGGLAND